MRVAVLTISDAGARGERADVSGDGIVTWTSERGYALVARALVPDDSVEIVRQLLAWCDGDEADLVLTTGGTGLSPRDNTPEATRAVLDREAAGIAERLRVVCIDSFPRAALSRGVAGSRGRTLIVNLPGSPRGAVECLEVIANVLPHAVATLRGETEAHPAPRSVRV